MSRRLRATYRSSGETVQSRPAPVDTRGRPERRPATLNDRAHIRKLRLDALEAVVDRPAEIPRRERHAWQRQQGQNREACINLEHQQDGDGEPERRIGEIHHGRADHHAYRTQVVRGPRHQVAGTVRLVVAQGQPLQAGEEIVAQAVFDFARRADKPLAHQVSKPALGDGQTEQHERVAGQTCPCEPGIEIVNDVPGGPMGRPVKSRS
jgi:hypothetical protein